MSSPVATRRRSQLLKISYASRSMRSKRRRDTSSQEGPSPSKVPKACWNEFTTRSLLEVMVEEIHAGNKVNGNFNTDGWRNIVRKFELRTKLPYNKVQLRNRANLIRKHYARWRRIHDHNTGLGINPNTGAIEMSDEWWNEMCKEDPEIIKWKTGPPQFLDLMTECFGCSVATGKGTYYPSYCKGGGTYPVLPRAPPPAMPPAYVPPLSVGDGGVAASNGPLDADSPMERDDTTRSKRRRTGTPRASTGEKMASSLAGCVEQFKRNNDIIESIFPPQSNRPEMIEAMSHINKLLGKDINTQLYIDAMKVVNNPDKRFLFMNYVIHMEPDMQISWLKQFAS